MGDYATLGCWHDITVLLTKQLKRFGERCWSLRLKWMILVSTMTYKSLKEHNSRLVFAKVTRVKAIGLTPVMSEVNLVLCM